MNGCENNKMVKSNRQSARIQQASRRSNLIYWFIILFELCVIGALFFTLKTTTNKLDSLMVEEATNVNESDADTTKDATKAMDSMSRIYTNDGTPIDLYVILDPDDGTQYVVSSRGGVCVRP